MEKKRVALITFDALVTNYHEIHEWLAYVLKAAGHHVTVISCHKALHQCTYLSSLPNQQLGEKDFEAWRTQICGQCEPLQNRIPSNAVLQIEAYKDRITEEQLEYVRDLQAILKDNPLSAVLPLTFGKLPAAKYAFFGFCHRHKLGINTRLDEGKLKEFSENVSDLLVFSNFLSRVTVEQHFDEVIYTNGNYTLNSWVQLLWKGRSRFTSIEHVFSCQTFWNRIFFQPTRLPIDSSWQSIKSSMATRKVSRRAISKSLRIFSERFLGNDFNSYTSVEQGSEEVAAFAQFRKKFSRIHSLFLSSSDELESHAAVHDFEFDATFFNSQANMVEELSGRLNPKIGYIVRVHPRLAPNKRSNFRSREIEEIQAALDYLSRQPNVMVILPDNKLSSYLVLMNSDLVFVTWSTVGLEALVGNIPSISAFPNNCMYPVRDLCVQPKDRNDFFSAWLGESPIDCYQVDSKKVLRWIAHVYWLSSLPVPSPRRDSSAIWIRVLNRSYRLLMKSQFCKLALFWIFKKTYGDQVLQQIGLSHNQHLLSTRENPPEAFPNQFLELYQDWRQRMKRRFSLP